jgi:hypothetical protein
MFAFGVGYRYCFPFLKTDSGLLLMSFVVGLLLVASIGPESGVVMERKASWAITPARGWCFACSICGATYDTLPHKYHCAHLHDVAIKSIKGNDLG